jgi:hypothetical protein
MNAKKNLACWCNQLDSLTNVARGKIWAWSDERRRLSKRKKDELDLIRILEAYPDVRELMPAEIRKQLDEG